MFHGFCVKQLPGSSMILYSICLMLIHYHCHFVSLQSSHLLSWCFFMFFILLCRFVYLMSHIFILHPRHQSRDVGRMLRHLTTLLESLSRRVLSKEHRQINLKSSINTTGKSIAELNLLDSGRCFSLAELAVDY